ncbi:MAG: N-acetyl-gamma-glutamyl-phosphate reductase [Proteobacteria bacterium]|nr:N-acetyl-gamma-glutamyl-phosphate reductase [Pseudomonadota bacterium]
MIKVGIAGASGYTGIELIKLISNHPEARLEAITSGSYTGKPLTDIFPSMRGFESLICEELDAKTLSSRVDLMFLALPHKVSMAHAAPLVEQGIKVIDLSADFRFKNPGTYEMAYQPHTAKDLLAESVYGLSEIYRDQIKTARIIGNPGCYPTTILLALLPLIKENLIEPDGIISDSKSGVSGAGRSLSLSTHYCEVNESFAPYKIGNHRHTPEIEEILSLHGKQDIKITFVPHLVPVMRGMVSTIYGQAVKSARLTDIRRAYEKYYSEEPFVRLLPEGFFPAMSHVRGTNCCDIGCHFDENTGRIILVSAIDNLLKGAAGQAVQNMNILFGLPDERGLNYVQTPL